MPKRIVDLFVLDIIVSIDRIKRYSKDLQDGDELKKNETLCSAVLRELGIIGEAMNQVLKTKKMANMVKPDWRDIVDFRNIVIHEYFGLSFNEIYIIIKKEIPVLEKDIIRIIQEVWPEKTMRQAFDDTMQELSLMGRSESVDYLMRIKKLLDKNR